MARLDFTENQRIIEDGRYLLRPFSIVSLFSQAQLQHIADDIQLGFKYLHRCRLHSLSGQLHPVFDMTVKQCFLLFFCFFQCFFNLCPLTLVLSVGSTEKTLASSSSFLSTRDFYTFLGFPLSLLILAEPLILWKMLQPLHHVCGHLLDLLQ